jgi:hypothetical protein
VLPMGLTIGNNAPTTRKVFFARSLNESGITDYCTWLPGCLGLPAPRGVSEELGVIGSPTYKCNNSRLRYRWYQRKPEVPNP